VLIRKSLWENPENGTDWTIGGADITLTSVWVVDSTGKVYVIKDPSTY
jgi:hypothetical protein